MIHGEDLVREREVPVGEALQEVVAQHGGDKNKAVTVGDALQAVARSSAGKKPVDFADAAALQAAVEGQDGVVAAALQAAETNVKPADERSGGVSTVRLRDVLGGGDNAAAAVPGADSKAVTREDAERVAAAARSSAGKRGAGTGKAVVEAMAAAADMNQQRMMQQ